MLLLRILLHISPILPLIYNRYYLTIALALLVASFYIKTFKIRVQIQQRDISTEDKEELNRLLAKWQGLTFLSQRHRLKD